SYPFDLMATDGKLFFMTSSGQLWVSDGTDAGTQALTNDSGAGRNGFFAVADRVYFIKFDPTIGTALFTTDGTTAGTSLVKVISGPDAGDSISSLVWGQANGTLYFAMSQSLPTPG